MKYYELDKYEKEILDAFDKGNLKSVENAKKKKKEYEAVAKYTLAKSKNISIRLSESDIYNSKVKAAELGIPYQTFISSIIHQAVS